MHARAPRYAGFGGAVLTLIAAPRAMAQDVRTPWSAWNASPVPIEPGTLVPIEEELLARCGVGEEGLRQTARAIAMRKLGGLPIPELDEIALLQREAGEPHPWARAWVATAHMLDRDALMVKLDAWLGLEPNRSLRRCGVASAASVDHGTHVLAVVTIDALADLAPLRTRARPGQWLTVEARLRVPATGGEVIVIGPGVAPRRLPTSLDGVTLRAHFAPERPGEYSLQVIAEVRGGPRPVLEAMVFAGVEPRAERDRVAPGEDAANGNGDDADCLAHMITEARASAGLGSLVRDSALDAIARDHAARMARARDLAHELGNGNPLERLRAAGVDARYAGENAAHASTLPLAHRSMWASPSHRANLLRREFDRIGVAVVRDDRGDAWVVETLASD